MIFLIIFLNDNVYICLFLFFVTVSFTRIKIILPDSVEEGNVPVNSFTYFSLSGTPPVTVTQCQVE